MPGREQNSSSLRRSRFVQVPLNSYFSCDVSAQETRPFFKGHGVLYGSNPSVGEPVFRVSDEGGFWRAWPLGHAQPVSPREWEKPTEFGGVAERVNRGKTVVKIEPFQISGIPHCGEGCGETLTGLKIEPSAGFETGKKFERTHRHAPIFTRELQILAVSAQFLAETEGRKMRFPKIVKHLRTAKTCCVPLLTHRVCQFQHLRATG